MIANLSTGLSLDKEAGSEHGQGMGFCNNASTQLLFAGVGVVVMLYSWQASQLVTLKR